MPTRSSFALPNLAAPPTNGAMLLSLHSTDGFEHEGFIEARCSTYQPAGLGWPPPEHISALTVREHFGTRRPQVGDGPESTGLENAEHAIHTAREIDADYPGSPVRGLTSVRAHVVEVGTATLVSCSRKPDDSKPRVVQANSDNSLTSTYQTFSLSHCC